ncbi:MAG: acyl carrier protein [Bacteroidetes bacterium]|nr:acyl carrier protein [Bacteroidota bacterium]
MNIDDFIKKVENEIDEITPGVLKPDTNFRDIAEWSSMHALILIALIDADYNVTITGEDLRNSKTMNDLFNIVKSRVS